MSNFERDGFSVISQVYTAGELADMEGLLSGIDTESKIAGRQPISLLYAGCSQRCPYWLA